MESKYWWFYIWIVIHVWWILVLVNDDITIKEWNEQYQIRSEDMWISQWNDSQYWFKFILFELLGLYEEGGVIVGLEVLLLEMWTWIQLESID